MPDAMSEKSMREILTLEFFVPHKNNGMREGFRRLALLFGGAGFVYMFELLWLLSNDFVMKYHTVHDSIVFDFVLATVFMLSGVLTFLVVASLTKLVGWAVEGFIK